MIVGPNNTSRSRVIALGVLLLLGVAIWLGPISTYFDLLSDGAEALARRNAVLQRYRALATARVEPEPASRPANVPAGMLPDIPEAQALAVVQEKVKAAAMANRVQVHSLQVLRTESIADAAKIGVRLRAAGDVASLGQFLHAIEDAQPVLYPDNLQVQAPPPVQGAATGSLEFQLDVSGFRAGAGS